MCRSYLRVRTCRYIVLRTYIYKYGRSRCAYTYLMTVVGPNVIHDVAQYLPWPTYMVFLRNVCTCRVKQALYEDGEWLRNVNLYPASEMPCHAAEKWRILSLTAGEIPASSLEIIYDEITEVHLSFSFAKRCRVVREGGFAKTKSKLWWDERRVRGEKNLELKKTTTSGCVETRK